jgi:hypothetical protein
MKNTSHPPVKPQGSAMTQNSNAPVQFKRVVSAEFGEHRKRIDICYQPDGFWTEDAVRVVLEFERYPRNKSTDDRLPLLDGLAFKYSIKTSSGGMNNDVSDLEWSESLIAALEDARMMVKQAQAFVTCQTAFITQAEYFLMLGMRPETLQHESDLRAVILRLEDDTHVYRGNFWYGKEALVEAIKSEQIADADALWLEATPAENAYWWFVYHAKGLMLFGQPDKDEQGEATAG